MTEPPDNRRKFVRFATLMIPTLFPRVLAAKTEVEVMHTRVFAALPGGGNPCPVIPDAAQLTDGQMQNLADKFGEDTAFVLPPSVHGADIRIRYFVPGHEMGVSGHATIAAVTVTAARRAASLNQFRVETLNGVFDVAWTMSGSDYLVTLEQNAPVFAGTTTPEAAASALAIRPDAIDVSKSPIQSVSVSRPKLIVPVVHSWVLDRMRPNFEVLWGLCDKLGVSGLYPFTRHTDKKDAQWEARQFPMRGGLIEDAATGVAAAALGAYLTRYDLELRPGHHEFRIAQGYAMGQPSLIGAIAECADGKITRTAVRGVAHVISREHISL